MLSKNLMLFNQQNNFVLKGRAIFVLSLCAFIFMGGRNGDCGKEQQKDSLKKKTQDESVVEYMDILDILEILDERDIDFFQDDFFSYQEFEGEKDGKDKTKKK